MACAILPPELVDAIIDLFHSDAKTLATISFVCKAWLHSARRHLFQYVRLDIYSPKFKRAREHLFNLLNSYSSLIPFIRHLELVGELGGVEWLNKCLPQLVGFVGIISLSLTQIPWKALTIPSKTTITHNFATIVNLSLRHVHFNTFCEFADFVCTFPSLHTIAIKSVVWDAPFSLPAHSCLPCTLRNLDLQQCKMEDIFTWLLSSGKVPAIRTMYLRRISLEQTKAVDGFLRATGNTLESVSFETTDDSRFFHSLDLSCNMQLRFIHFNVRQPCYSLSENEWVIGALSQIVSDNTEEVSFSVMYPRYFDWSRLDMILLQPQFCKLKKVQIYYYCVLHRTEEEDWYRKSLPICHARGILLCSLR